MSRCLMETSVYTGNVQLGGTISRKENNYSAVIVNASLVMSYEEVIIFQQRNKIQYWKFKDV